MTKRDVVLHKETQEPDGTLNLQAVCCIPDDDSPAGCNKITEEQKQILAICDSFCAKEDNNINGLSGSLDRSDQAMDHLMNIDGLIDLEIMKAQHSIMVFRIVLKRFMRLREVFSLTLKLLAISNSEGVEDKTLVFHSKPLLPFKVNSISYLCITRDHYE
ncbi:hypothetical protein BRARA_F02949 [Brassica rapa]|nr:hypothetical protein BRARA_F02949 [Brassica rapa]